MKKILITGITGFVGNHLKDHLDKNDYEVHGTSLSQESTEGNTQIHKVNLLDEENVFKLIQELQPDLVIHLAALSSPKKSFENPKEFLQNNTDAQLNLLLAIKKAEISPRILIVSSGEIYGSQEKLPINEAAPLFPTSPYSVSKITQDYLALQYFLSEGMDIIRVRPFNHIGPGQSDEFVVSSFAKQIAELERNDGIVKVGNLSAKRDFTDVRDMVKAYVLILEKGKSGEVYNIGRGISYEVKFILDTLISLSGKDIRTEVDKSRLRPIDIPDIICENTKIHEATGWTPEIPLEKTLQDTLDYWRQII